ncbi:hypothetical protein Hanom_Chr01g00071131 [Helianthus anomalus]
MKMARSQTFWIKMRKTKPLDESRKTGQCSGTKLAFYSLKRKTKQRYTLMCYLRCDPSKIWVNNDTLQRVVLETNGALPLPAEYKL